jgi:catechol 2,3-dioxygenase-like lactoylglutathione lyase family enzyme
VSTNEIRFEAVTPQFTVPDLVKTANYYRDVLGFRISSFWDGERAVQIPKGPVYFAIVCRDHVQVFFNQADGAAPRSGPAEGYDAYFHVAGVDALSAELRRRGADIIEEPGDRIYGQRELVVRDCNGLTLAFAQSR